MEESWKKLEGFIQEKPEVPEADYLSRMNY